MKIESLGLDTDTPAAQEAKRLGIAAHDAIKHAVQGELTKADGALIHDSQREVGWHQRMTKWSYYKPASRNGEPYWTYRPKDGVEVRIYDKEDQS